MAKSRKRDKKPSAVIHIRVDKAIKRDASENLRAVGMTISQAMKIYLAQIVLQGGIPYKGFVTVSNRVTTAADRRKELRAIEKKVIDAEAEIIAARYERTGELELI